MSGAARTLAVVVVLALVLTWLLVRGAGPNEAAFAAVQATLDSFALNEAALHRDVLRARDGLLQTYDPLVAEVEALQQASQELQDQFSAGPVAKGLTEHLAATAAEQEQRVEQFKTDNAQLQNSLTYFDLLSSSIGGGGTDKADAPSSLAPPSLARRIGGLGSAMLHMTRNPSPEVAIYVERLLDGVGGNGLSGPAARDQPSATQEALTTLVRHGRVLVRLLPAMDSGIAELFAMPVDDLLKRIKAEADAQRQDEKGMARWFQVALYATALLLLAVAARAAVQLRASARALQRRAALEHVITGVSTRFIGCPPDHVAARLGESLALLGPAFGANRAYLLLGDARMDVQTWAAPGMAAPPPDWPDAALRFVPGLASADGAAWCQVTASLPPGQMREVLAKAQVSGWAGVALQHGRRRLGLLCLDRAGPAAGWPFGGLGLLRMTGEVLGNALHSRVAAQERAELRARLLRARRLEALGTFASGIAHNFNNIVGAVIGHAEMAADRLEPLAPAAGHVQEIHRAGERARDLVGQILDFGTSGRVRREAVSVDALAGGNHLHAAGLAAARGGPAGWAGGGRLGVRRPWPGAAGAGQPDPQCRPGDHAAGQGDDRGGVARGGRAPPTIARQPGRRQLYLYRGRRHWRRHGQRHPGPHLRSVLHHAPCRHRPGPGHGPRHHRRLWWRHGCRKCARGGQPLRRLAPGPAVIRGCSGCGLAGPGANGAGPGRQPGCRPA